MMLQKVDVIVETEKMMFASVRCSLGEREDLFLQQITKSMFAIAFSLFGKNAAYDLFKLYMGKNVLNTFRQNHGYKEGTYKKIWNGEEDNVVMQRLLEKVLKNQTESLDSMLYVELEKAYNI